MENGTKSLYKGNSFRYNRAAFVVSRLKAERLRRCRVCRSVGADAWKYTIKITIMLFNTPEFVGFFLVVLMLVWWLNFWEKVVVRNILLLLISYGFYARFHVLVPLLLLYVTLVNYAAGKVLRGGRLSSEGRFYCVSLAVIASITPLLVLKYLPAYVEGIWLPVGLSFFTFQALSYTLDVYRGKIEEAYSLLDVSLFTAFFPTLLSGPIERARKLVPQLRQRFPMSWDNLVVGSQHFVWGLFKKMVIADRLAPMVDGAYAQGTAASGGTLALAAVLYSFQIYCDFSGYASMALGVGRMLGIKLTQNFEFPYFANSIKEFWRRWHISLTSWFTEYVYISLGGNRVSRMRWVLNISAVFLLSGIWHGATWSFVIWGGIHGILYLVEYFTGIKDKWGLYRLVVFVGVTLAWVFFRIPQSSDAMLLIAKMFTGPWLPIRLYGGMTVLSLITLALLLLFLVVELFLYRGWVPRNRFVRMLAFSALLMMISIFAASSDQFVYFNF